MTQMTLDDAEQAKRDGMQAADNAATFLWRDEADAAIRRAAATGEEFQTYDLVSRFDCPEPADHHAWGQRMSDAARAGLIVKVGYAPSVRPTSKRSVMAVWRGVA